MRVLAIETATVHLGISIADENGVVAEMTLIAGRAHAERLHSMVAVVANLAETGLPELDGVAVDVGPGLFTGIRVGVAAAKGYSMALGLPLVGLSSLEVLASAASSPGRVSVPVVDLKRGELAWLLPGQEAAHGAPEALAEELRTAFAGRKVLLAGDGALRYSELLTEACPSAAVAGPELAAAPVASLAVLALAEVAAGGGKDAGDVAPVYLRDADVRINWTTRHDSPRQEPRRRESHGQRAPRPAEAG